MYFTVVPLLFHMDDITVLPIDYALKHLEQILNNTVLD